MEIEGDDGSKTELHSPSQSIFGRGSGFTTDDVTVSRRHLLLRLEGANNKEQPPRVSFEVIGTNPAWVRTGGEVKTFKKSDKGELRNGDSFCISSRPPVWFRLTKTMVPQSEAEVDNVDASQIDPVKEFGFVVIGREFEGYSKGRVRDAKEWDWFLKDAAEDEDEEGSSHGGLRRRKKRKGRRDEEEDEDWSDEMEEEKEIEVNAKRKSKEGGTTYVTRSKQVKREKKGNKKEEKEEDEDEDDETLGGFIVDEEELDEEEEEEEEDEEELMDDDEEEDGDV